MVCTERGLEPNPTIHKPKLSPTPDKSHRTSANIQFRVRLAGQIKTRRFHALLWKSFSQTLGSRS
jgi:hypothetical protein